MGRPCLFSVLLVSVLLLLSFSHGLGRQLMETSEFQDSTVHLQDAAADSRETIEAMDYKDPGPNTNPKAGYIFSPPPRG